PWQSGYAADCKSVDLGSTPGGASILSKTRLIDGFFRFIYSFTSKLIIAHYQYRTSSQDSFD
ncbi:hypothetical protein ACPV55_21210, partial [Vibrio mediterranei]